MNPLEEIERIFEGKTLSDFAEDFITAADRALDEYERTGVSGPLLEEFMDTYIFKARRR